MRILAFKTHMFAVTSFQFSVRCFRNDDIFRLGDRRVKPGVAIYNFPKRLLLSSHDVWRRDLKVNEPNCLLNEVRKGDPFAPNERKRMKPPLDGM